MIDDEMYETCKDCPYYYGEINWCMYGEEGAPDNLEKKCEVKNESNNIYVESGLDRKEKME